MRETFADNVVLRSPITSRFHFAGVDQVVELLELVHESIEAPTVTDELQGNGSGAVISRMRVGKVDAEAVALLEIEGERIHQLTIFFRPYPALAALIAALGPRVARRRGRWQALLVRLATAPLAVIARVADRLGAPLARPG
jgi:hypothetical protein